MGNPRRYLVIRLSSLGDIVLTTPVFQALRDADPTAYIAALVKESFADVLAGNPAINEIFQLRHGESVWSIARRVRAAGFDVVIDLHSNLRSWVIRVLSGAPQRLRYRKAAMARRLFVRWRLPSAQLSEHTLDRYLTVLKPLGIDIGTTRLSTAAPVQNVLVIQTAFLGDAVLTTPLLGALREAYPNARITVLCTPEIVDVFKEHPAVAELVVYDKHGQHGAWTSLRALVNRLKQGKFDTAIIPHRSFRSAWIAWLTRIPRRIGFSRSQGRWFLTDVVPFRWGVHDVDRNLALLHVLGLPKKMGQLYLKPDPAASHVIKKRLAEAGMKGTDSILGINAGSVWATKRWLPERFGAVADRLARELGVKVVFFGAPKDKPVMESVRAAMVSDAIDLVGKTTLKELIAGVSLCSVFLTNDSGPMHIAVACKVPTVAIFGPTTKELGFFPYGEGHAVIEKTLSCRPCGLHGADVCPLGHFECMRSITTDDVFQAVRKAFVGTASRMNVIPERGSV